EIYDRGAISFGGTGLLALGFAVGPAGAMAAAVFAAGVRLAVSRGRLYRAVFDAAQLALAAGCATLLYLVPFHGTMPRLALQTLADEVRKTHRNLIAALSRSMEAKDFYTGGHVERVAEIAVALGRRLGYDGEELDAIEIGALLHDIGKIGIPEKILHKPGPLDDDEWKVMREHPIISEHILSGIGLSPLVLQIARSSHERIDGTGYPDALAGEAIPLAA